MSTLRDRIRGKYTTNDAHPATQPKDYGAPTEIPMVRVAMYTNGVAYDEPLATADGAVIPATGPGQWGQLYAAGR